MRRTTEELNAVLHKMPDRQARLALVREWLRELKSEQVAGLYLPTPIAAVWPHDILCATCRGHHKAWDEETCQMIQRRQKNEGSSGGSSAPMQPGKVLTALPSVWEFLSMRNWPDGSPRVTGTFTVCMQERGIQIVLKDRDSQGVAFFTAETLDQALRAADKALEANQVEWRDDKYQGGSGKRRS